MIQMFDLSLLSVCFIKVKRFFRKRTCTLKAEVQSIMILMKLLSKRDLVDSADLVLVHSFRA